MNYIKRTQELSDKLVKLEESMPNTIFKEIAVSITYKRIERVGLNLSNKSLYKKAKKDFRYVKKIYNLYGSIHFNESRKMKNEVIRLTKEMKERLKNDRPECLNTTDMG